MLTASVTTPNPPQEGSDVMGSLPTRIPPPIPQNWRGVAQGLKDAASLLQHHCYAQAETSLLQLLEFAPMEGKAWHLLGRCHQARKQHAKALECFAQAACCYGKQSHGDAQPASTRLARLLWDQGEKHAALDMLGLLLKRQPDDVGLLALQQDWEQEPTDTPFPTGRNA
jgi:tetratricopeptide (TPR) repeat protein